MLCTTLLQHFTKLRNIYALCAGLNTQFTYAPDKLLIVWVTLLLYNYKATSVR